jgi:hypothetical protein
MGILSGQLSASTGNADLPDWCYFDVYIIRKVPVYVEVKIFSVFPDCLTPPPQRIKLLVVLLSFINFINIDIKNLFYHNFFSCIPL